MNCFVFGQRFENVELQAQRGIEGWEIEIESKLAVGELTVPFEFDQGIPMKLDMDRLLLMDPDRSDSGTTDPRTLPPIQAKIAEFAIGEVLFGALEASAVSVPQGLQTEKLEITGSSFSVTGAGEWLVIEDTPRSRLQLSLASTDVLDTLVNHGLRTADGRRGPAKFMQIFPGKVRLARAFSTVQLVRSA